MIHVGGWDEYAFAAQGPIANYGSLTLSLKNIRISETIDNQGELYYSAGSEALFDAGRYVAGNAPVDLDQE